MADASESESGIVVYCSVEGFFSSVKAWVIIIELLGNFTSVIYKIIP